MSFRSTAVAPVVFAALAFGVGVTPVSAEPVARVGDLEIDRSELEESLAGPLLQLEMQKAQLLERGLRALIDRRLLEHVAAAKGLTPESLVESLEVPAVTETDVLAFYEENRSRIGKPLDEVREAIGEMIAGTRRQEALQRELEAASGGIGVDWRLDPWRVDVDNGAAPRRGDPAAPVEVTVFSDFECPWCRRLVPVLEELEGLYGERLTVAFRQFPLTSIHARAEEAALATICAADQERFWDFHDALFERPDRLESAALPAVARELGLDVGRWEECRRSEDATARLDVDVATARSLGVASTPSVFVNGRPVAFRRDATPLDQLVEVVEDELERRGGARG